MNKRIVQVLFKCPDKTDTWFHGTLLNGAMPVVTCGACGHGVCLAIVNQICSAGCGAYVAEAVSEGQRPSYAMPTLDEKHMLEVE